MSLITVGTVPMPLPVVSSVDGGVTLLDAASEMAWSILPILRSGGGSLTHIHFRTGGVTTGTTLLIRVETPNASGQPSGVLWGTTTEGTQVILDAEDNTLFRVALTLPAAVDYGDVIVVKLQNPAASFGNLNIVGAASRLSGVIQGFPHGGGPLSTTKSNTVGPAVLLEYSDGAVEVPAFFLPGPCTIATMNLSTATNPDEVGLLFTAPVSGRLSGWWLFSDQTAGITCRVALYASGNDTPLATTTRDTDYTAGTAERLVAGVWDNVSAGVQVVAGSVYRVSVVALSASALVLYTVAVSANTVFDTLGLPGAQYTARNRTSTVDPDAAAWTETATMRVQMGVIYDQIEVGGGGGPLTGGRLTA